MTPQARQLAAVAEQVDLVNKMITLKLNPAEYIRLKTSDLDALPSQWSTTLNRLLVEQALPARSFEGLSELTAASPKLRQFYEAANARDAAMIEQTITKLAQSGERLAVLITGGFHSPAVTKGLRQRGAQVLVVATTVTHELNDQQYRAVLRCKSGRGGCAEMVPALPAGRPSDVSSTNTSIPMAGDVR